MPWRVRRSTIRAGQHEKSRRAQAPLVYRRARRTASGSANVDGGELPGFRLARNETLRAEVEPFVAGSQRVR